jgi:hypothetical protein
MSLRMLVQRVQVPKGHSRDGQQYAPITPGSVGAGSLTVRSSQSLLSATIRSWFRRGRSRLGVVARATDPLRGVRTTRIQCPARHSKGNEVLGQLLGAQVEQVGVFAAVLRVVEARSRLPDPLAVDATAARHAVARVAAAQIERDPVAFCGGLTAVRPAGDRIGQARDVAGAPVTLQFSSPCWPTPLTITPRLPARRGPGEPRGPLRTGRVKCTRILLA